MSFDTWNCYVMKVEDTFQISGRGLVVVGTFVGDHPSAGPVEVVFPDGIRRYGFVCGVEMPYRLRHSVTYGKTGLLLRKFKEIPVGTVIASGRGIVSE